MTGAPARRRPGIWSGAQARAEVLGRRDGLEHAGHDLARAGSGHLVRGLRLDELGVGEDDPQLVVQSVKELADVGRLVHSGPLPIRVRTRPLAGRAVRGLARYAAGRITGYDDASFDQEWWLWPEACGSRQRVSTKMRTEPPAVRTYSTFPLAIQL